MGNGPYDQNYGQYPQQQPDPYGQQNYQQPQVMFQQAPPPGYPQPPGQQPPPPPPARKAGAGGMVMAIIGGIMALLSVFMLFWMSTSGDSDYYMDSGFMGIGDLGDDYIYAWLIPIFGILVLIFGIIAFSIQNKVMAVLTGVFGLLVILLPLALALHLSSDVGSIVDVFYYSDSYSYDYLYYDYSYSVTRIYLGGMMAMIGGIMGTIGGFSMIGKMK